MDLWEDNKTLWMACWLDPRHSSMKFIDDSGVRVEMIEKCKEEARLNIGLGDVYQGLDLLDQVLYSNVAEPDAVEEYCRKTENDPALDVLKWWAGTSSSLSPLIPLVKRYLCVPASSAPSERVFSQCNLVLTANRAALTKENARMLCLASLYDDLE